MIKSQHAFILHTSIVVKSSFTAQNFLKFSKIREIKKGLFIKKSVIFDGDSESLRKLSQACLNIFVEPFFC